MQWMKKYYKVCAKCGHVGRNSYILKWFYVKAESGSEAAKKVRYTSRVKHNKKDAIKEVVEISFDEYKIGKKIQSEDMYFRVHNRQDQKLYCNITQDEIYPEELPEKYKKYDNSKNIKIYKMLENESKKIIQRGEYYG